MSREINKNLYPTGGYFFIEKDGLKIKAGSWVAVEAAVRQYRANKGVPEGDVHAEVMAQACDRNPALCHESAPSGQKPVRPTSLKTRAFQWLGNLCRTARSSGLKYVSDAEARRRAAICDRCPAQKRISQGCSTCEHSLQALRNCVLGGRKPVVDHLEGCDALGCDLSCAVHLDEPRLGDPNLPGECWRR